MRLLVCSAAALALAGCVSDQALRASFRAFDGGPVAAITSKLGTPASESTVAGARWYAWEWRAGDLQCRFSARVNSSGVVAETTIHGNRGACQQLEQQLR